ncbi:hypothetical protein [Marinoscillum sp. MHG1-6]|uniref:hypothetical protein n=1 Tax=Marinoscillum sp. MHG1-6 TaxID=2959627 RepID=UPI0021575054|nr:hypothetical protein [Marinoscillum sp. MHG1-6]
MIVKGFFIAKRHSERASRKTSASKSLKFRVTAQMDQIENLLPMMRLFILHIPMDIGTGFRVTVINDIK